MKIFFDGKIFSQQKQGGISRVGFELIKTLSQLPNVEQQFYRGFHVDAYPFKKEWFKDYFGVRTPFQGKIINFLDNFFSERFYQKNADEKTVYHSLYYRVPRKPKGPVVVYCYDMIHELFTQEKKSIAFKKQAFDKADLIIAISESAKQDILKIYPHIQPDKVKVVYLGVSEVFLQPHRPRKMEKPYVLYVGPRGYKYKNFDLLLETFIENGFFQEYNLVAVGGEKELNESQKAKINSAKGGEWFIHEFGNDEQLAELYSGAAAFVYPSLYEGFGIPPLEAMAQGCPVLVASSSSLPEVVGEAALMFDPVNKEDFSKKLHFILTDELLSKNLIEKGRDRIKIFTWGSACEAILKTCSSLTK